MQPLRSSPITEPSIPTTGCSAPVLRIGTLILVDLATWTSPFTSERQVLTFLTKPDPASRRLHAGCRSGSLQDAPELIPEDGSAPGFDIA